MKGENEFGRQLTVGEKELSRQKATYGRTEEEEKEKENKTNNNNKKKNEQINK